MVIETTEEIDECEATDQLPFLGRCPYRPDGGEGRFDCGRRVSMLRVSSTTRQISSSIILAKGITDPRSAILLLSQSICHRPGFLLRTEVESIIGFFFIKIQLIGSELFVARNCPCLPSEISAINFLMKTFYKKQHWYIPIDC